MRIGRRISLGFGSILLLLAVMGLLLYFSSLLTNDYLRVFEREASLRNVAHDLDRQVLELQRNALIFASTGQNAMVRRVEDNHRAIVAGLEDLAERIGDEPAREQLVARLSRFSDGYLEGFRRLTEDRFRRDTLYAKNRLLSQSIDERLDTAEDSPGVIDARRSFARLDRAFLNYVDSPDSAEVRAARRELRALRTSLDARRDGELLEMLNAYEETVLDTVQAIRGYLFLANVVLAGQAAEFDYDSDRLQIMLREQETASIAQIDANTRRGRVAAIAIGLFAVLGGALAASLVGGSIRRPLERITSTFRRLAAGQEIDQVAGLDREDEIGELAAAAQVFKERNQQTQELLELSRARGEQLEAQAIKLEHANEELGQFAYIASHDLQEPLRMVASYVELLREEYEGKLGDEADQYIRFAVDGSKRMQGLIHDLLALSQIGRIEKEIETVSTRDLVEDVLSDLAIPLEESGLRVDCGVLPEIRAYPSLLRQVFQNYVSNAIKYRGESEDPFLEVRCTESAEGWTFTFNDNGIGIDADYYDKVFLVFQRLHRRSKYPGSGIGLAIVKKIAEQHEGRAWVESEVGVGSTFHILVGRI